MIIKNKQNKAFSIANLLIAPGINEIDNTNYEFLKEHDFFNQLLQNNVIKVINNKSIKDVKEEIAKEINPKKANEIVKEITVNEVKGDFDKKQIKSKDNKKTEDNK